MALLNKGFILGRLNNPKGAEEIYEQISLCLEESTLDNKILRVEKTFDKASILDATRYRMAEVVVDYQMYQKNRIAQNKKQIAQNKKQIAQNKKQIAQLKKQYDIFIELVAIFESGEENNINKNQLVFTTFQLWLDGMDEVLEYLLSFIKNLFDHETKFDWNGDDIRPLVDKLPEPRKTQAECFIAFFEQHHDISTLKTCLQASTEWPKGYFDQFGSWEGEPLQRPEQNP